MTTTQRIGGQTINFFERSVGKCRTCKTPVRVDRWVSSASCPNCGGTVKVAQVIGTDAPHVKCDARCQTATSGTCECSCGGHYHGTGIG